jgi:PAS domain S-box-containing protein
MSETDKSLAQEAYLVETVRSLFRGLPAVLFANASVALVFVVTQWGVSSTRLLVWASVLALVLAIRLALYMRFRTLGHLNQPRFAAASFAPAKWLWIFRFGVFLAACAWGLAGLFFMDSRDPILLAYVILALGGLCAGSITALAPDNVSALIFIFVTPTPALIMMQINNTPGASGMALFFLIGILFVALTTHRATEAMLELYQARLKSLQAARALSESEQRWKFALEGAKQAVWEWNIAANRELFTSAKWREMLGYSAHDEFDHSIDAWRANIHPDDAASVDEALKVAFAKDANMFSTIYRYAHRNGSWLWVHSRGIVVARDIDGKPLRMIGTRENITETRALQDQLNHAQRLRTIGQLAGGVAHDFNNNLTAMMMSLDLLKSDASLSASAQECVGELELMTDRASKITSQLLMFSRQQSVRVQSVDLSLAIRRLHTVLKRLVGDGIDLALNVPDQQMWANVDSAMFDQALINLVLNAKDAMPGGGSLTLRLAKTQLNAQAVRLHAQRKVGSFLSIEIEDTGEGMTADVQKHLFEPFFTTKGLGLGTGLGLASVHGMVHQHEGWIEVLSQPGKGSLFTIFLPALDDATRASIEAQNDHSLGSKSSKPNDPLDDATRASIEAQNDHSLGSKSSKPNDPLDDATRLSIGAKSEALLSPIEQALPARRQNARRTGIGESIQTIQPSASEQAFSSAVKAPAGTPLLTGGGKRILIVEDEPLVRDGVVRMLRHLGYQAMAAENAEIALEIWQQQDASFDLLLTDLVMPGTQNGLSLARQLRKMKPQLPIILMSGYSSETTQAELRTAEDARHIEFLSKPFDLTALRTRVHQALCASVLVVGTLG